jgi:predicted  nucleic acid-binding Zn-ribbon protein
MTDRIEKAARAIAETMFEGDPHPEDYACHYMHHAEIALSTIEPELTTLNEAVFNVTDERDEAYAELEALREALDIIEQNCEASASSYEARIKTIHGVIRLYSKREEAG